MDVTPCDVFEPELIRDALEVVEFNLGTLIFGESQWKLLAAAAGLPSECVSNQNVLAECFHNLKVRSLSILISRYDTLSYSHVQLWQHLILG